LELTEKQRVLKLPGLIVDIIKEVGPIVFLDNIEILFDKGEQYSCGKDTCKPGCDCDRYLEVWNLVFTQFDRQEDGSLKNLPQRNIDTGMGFERLLSVLQNVQSGYETDLFQPIWTKISTLLTKTNANISSSTNHTKPFRIICDHLRSSVFLISDGVFPANEGRGYVLKRLIRRAIRQGNKLGLYNFVEEIVLEIIKTMSPAYPYLQDKKNICIEILKKEEQKFGETIAVGEKILDETIENLKRTNKNIISGEDVFKLFDTYGMPVDLIDELAKEDGFSIDLAGYKKAMEEQKIKSRQNIEGWDVKDNVFSEILEKHKDTKFVGYTKNIVETKLLEILKLSDEGTVFLDEVDSNQNEIGIILQETPFYAESGGQKSDQGFLYILDANNNGQVVAKLEISNSKKYANSLTVSFGKVLEGKFKKNDTVVGSIDLEKRNNMRKNHTATHILQSVLRKKLGNHIEQSGSEVTPTGFRFDFTHPKAIDEKILKEIELDVNNIIQQNYQVQTKEMTIDEAKKTGALAFFEEKYGDKVRVVKITKNLDFNDDECISTEFCGGTHANMTGEIGLLKITSEASVSSGIRRIEAITGITAYNFVNEMLGSLKDISIILKTTPEKTKSQLESLITKTKSLEKEIENLSDKIISLTIDDIINNKKKINGKNILVCKLGTMDMNGLRRASDQLRAKMNNAVMFLLSKKGDDYSAICLITKDLPNYDAKKIMKNITEKFGGGGGGRPDMAQAGLTTTASEKEILEFAEGIIKAEL
jgi:alanyl-tRNA synthetase